METEEYVKPQTGYSNVMNKIKDKEVKLGDVS